MCAQIHKRKRYPESHNTDALANIFTLHNIILHIYYFIVRFVFSSSILSLLR